MLSHNSSDNPLALKINLQSACRSFCAPPLSAVPLSTPVPEACWEEVLPPRCVTFWGRGPRKKTQSKNIPKQCFHMHLDNEERSNRGFGDDFFPMTEMQGAINANTTRKEKETAWQTSPVPELPSGASLGRAAGTRNEMKGPSAKHCF